MLMNDVKRANDKVSSSVRVYAQSLVIDPDQSDRLQVGQSKTYRFYALIVGDTGGVVEVIRPSAPAGWSLRLCDANGVNDLTDTDGDGIPDLGFVAPGDQFVDRHVEIEPAEAGLAVQQVLEEALPAGVGVGWGRADLQECTVNVEDDGADAHVREFHRSG